MSMFPDEYLATQWDQTQLMDGTPILAVIDRRKTSENALASASYPIRVVLTNGYSFTATDDGYGYEHSNKTGRRLKPVAPPTPTTRPLTRDEWPDGPVMVRFGPSNSFDSYANDRVMPDGIIVDELGFRSWQHLHDEGWEYHTGQGEWTPCKVFE